MTLEDKFCEYEGDVNLNWRDMDTFDYIIMDRNVTSNTKTLRRIQSFETLVFGGNCNGIVGYGKGKGNSFVDALDRAVMNLFTNLISINLDALNTFPKPIRSRFNRTEITMFPRDHFNSWGHVLYADMI